MLGSRILGIDYGSHRIGLSLSDPTGKLARPIQAMRNTQSVLSDICCLIEKEEVGLVIVGMPFNLKGKQAKQSEEVARFIEHLKAETNVEISTFDERFTTTIAKRTMLMMGTKKKDRQMKDGRIDSMAAAVMLQGFLDSRKYSAKD
jgi:putative Holliday junction resolvase